MGTLLDDGSHVDSLVPPSRLGNGLVGGGLAHQPAAEGNCLSTLTYRALVAITVRLLSWMIFFIIWTHRRYRSMYPTETMLPFLTSDSETS